MHRGRKEEKKGNRERGNLKKGEKKDNVKKRKLQRKRRESGGGSGERETKQLYGFIPSLGGTKPSK